MRGFCTSPAQTVDEGASMGLRISARGDARTGLRLTAGYIAVYPPSTGTMMPVT